MSPDVAHHICFATNANPWAAIIPGRGLSDVPIPRKASCRSISRAGPAIHQVEGHVDRPSGDPEVGQPAERPSGGIEVG